MPLLFRRAAAEKFSPGSLNASHRKASGAFDSTQGGLPPPSRSPAKTRVDSSSQKFFDKLKRRDMPAAYPSSSPEAGH